MFFPEMFLFRNPDRISCCITLHQGINVTIRDGCWFQYNILSPYSDNVNDGALLHSLIRKLFSVSSDIICFVISNFLFYNFVHTQKIIWIPGGAMMRVCFYFHVSITQQEASIKQTFLPGYLLTHCLRVIVGFVALLQSFSAFVKNTHKISSFSQSWLLGIVLICIHSYPGVQEACYFPRYLSVTETK